MNYRADEHLVHEELMEDHRFDSARAGSVCGLSDGSLYLVYISGSFRLLDMPVI